MFCPKCGTQVPDEAKFCPACCEPMAKQDAKPQNTPAPEAAVATARTAVVKPTKPLKKGNLISNLMHPKFRLLAVIALVVWVAAMGITLGSYFVANNTLVYEYPVVTLITDMVELDDMGIEGLDTEDIDTDDGLESILDEYREPLEEAKENLREDFSGLSDKDYKKIENLVDAAVEFMDEPTMANLQALMDTVEDGNTVLEKNRDYFDAEFTEEGLEAVENLQETFDQIEEHLAILKLIPYILLIFTILCLLFTFFGGLFKLNGLVIPGMIFTALFTFAFAGVLWLVLAMIAQAGIIAMNIMLKKTYKRLRNA